MKNANFVHPSANIQFSEFDQPATGTTSFETETAAKPANNTEAITVPLSGEITVPAGLVGKVRISAPGIPYMPAKQGAKGTAIFSAAEANFRWGNENNDSNNKPVVKGQILLENIDVKDVVKMKKRFCNVSETTAELAPSGKAIRITVAKGGPVLLTYRCGLIEGQERAWFELDKG